MIRQALKSSWQEFSDDWKNGCYVSLKYEEKSWYIQINKTGEGCYFGKGWKDFYDAVGLQEGDFIVCFREKVKESHKLIVCIYRVVDHRNALDNVMKDFNDSSKSFFKIIHEKAASSGYLMVPFIVEQLYCWKLRQVEKISIAGVQSRFYYLSFPGYMYMLQDLFKDFRVRINDTLIFTLNGSKTINCRIYQENGMEIDYVYRVGRKKGGGAIEWIWNFEPQSGTGQVDALSNATQHGQIMEEPADNDLTFTAILTSGNLDKKTHGLFIPENVKPSRGIWLRSDNINFITDKGLWKVGIAQTGKTPRFSAGWNSFVRDNMYTPGQHLHFRMVEQADVIEFHISKI